MRIAPSILSADFSRLGDEVKRAEDAGAELIHWDVMDGRFVPNITIGPDVIAAARKSTTLPFDIHLMIERPDIYLDRFISPGVEILTIHIEASCDIAGTLRKIREAGVKAGLSLRPGTALEKLGPFLDLVDLILVMSVEPGFGGQGYIEGSERRIASLAARRDPEGSFLIEVDGGINADTGRLCAEAGADILVAGSYLFGAADMAERISGLKCSRS